MSEIYVIHDYHSKSDFYAERSARQTSGKKFAVQIIEDPKKIRSALQNNSIHLWCRLAAQSFNDGGLDKRVFFKEPFFLNWNEGTVKNDIWRPVQTSLGYGASTATLERQQVTEVYDNINLKLIEHGYSVPFPSRT